MRLIIITILLIFVQKVSNAEERSESDTVSRVELKQFILPAGLITYGIIGLESPWIHQKNRQITNYFSHKWGTQPTLTIFCNMPLRYRYTRSTVLGCRVFVAGV